MSRHFFPTRLHCCLLLSLFCIGLSPAFAATPEVQLNLDAIDRLQKRPTAAPTPAVPPKAETKPAAEPIKKPLPAAAPSKPIRKPLPENVEYPRIQAPSHDPRPEVKPAPPKKPAAVKKPAVKKPAEPKAEPVEAPVEKPKRRSKKHAATKVESVHTDGSSDCAGKDKIVEGIENATGAPCEVVLPIPNDENPNRQILPKSAETPVQPPLPESKPPVAETPAASLPKEEPASPVVTPETIAPEAPVTPMVIEPPAPPKTEAPVSQAPAIEVPAIASPPATKEAAPLPPLDALKTPAEKKPEAKKEPLKAPAEEKPKSSQAKAAPVTPVEETIVPPPPGLEPKPEPPTAPAAPVVLGEIHKTPEEKQPETAPPAETPAPAPTPAATPEPAPAPAAAEKPAETAVPDAQLVFKTTETAVPLSLRANLDALAARLKENDQLRARLVSYATATGNQATTARRVSLARALSVRIYLIDKGVESKRINVHAEGDRNPGGEPDRVDIFLTNGE